nr:reverse transcriptase domain-containing protein [Tanacetum cinerariifolium]
MKMNTASSPGSRTLPSNTITNPKEDLKVKRETEVTKDTVPPTNNGSTKDVQPLVVQVETPIPNFEPVIAPIIEPVIALVSDPKPNQKLSIPYPSRLHDQKVCNKANDQKEKFFQIFQDLNFNISFADALILMPKFGPTIKSLLTNKDKLYELARTPLNKHCSMVLLKKLPEKRGDPDKFLIPCDFSRMDECLALADLDASINLMPLSVWNKLSLRELSLTCMTLELADRLISRPFGVAKDVFTRKALIDVYEGELTLCVGKEAVTFNLDQTSRYSANYNDMKANRINVIDMAYEEYSQEVLGFFDVIAIRNPTPYYDPIVSTSSPTLTPFGDSDFLLEEVDAFLAFEDDPTSSKFDHSYYNTKGDILLLKAFLNDDPLLPPPTQGMNKYIFMVVDYLSKWVEAKALPTNDARVVCKILKSLFARFRTPRAIIIDRGMHFCNDQFTKVMLKYGVTHRLAIAYHPQTSGQVEVSNRGLKRILERTVGENRASWSDKLDDALWAFRTAFKTAIGCTPYKLVYGKASFENSLIYKEKSKRLHDSKIKDRVFNVGDRVLLFNSRLKVFLGKLKIHWSGPFTITKVFPYGTVDLSQTDMPNFKVNGHRLKHYFGEDIPKMDVPDLQTFPKDQ